MPGLTEQITSSYPALFDDEGRYATTVLGLAQGVILLSYARNPSAFTAHPLPSGVPGYLTVTVTFLSFAFVACVNWLNWLERRSWKRHPVQTPADFQLVDLGDQQREVERYLAAFADDASKLAWLAQHGKLIPTPDIDGHQGYMFESFHKKRRLFFLDKDRVVLFYVPGVSQELGVEVP
jgi:hypothetical protein